MRISYESNYLKIILLIVRIIIRKNSNINNFDNINNMIHQFIIDKNNIEFISFAKSNGNVFNSYTILINQ